MDSSGQGSIPTASGSESLVYQQLAGALAGNVATSNSQSEPSRPSARVFRKGGVMTALGEYIAEVNTLSVTPRHMNAQPSSHKLGPQIATSNVGYQLLQKAGWAEGQGLGRNQQGRPIPLGAYHQQARQGIGVGTTQPGHPQHSLDSTSKRGRASAGDDKAKKPQQKQQLPVPHVPEDPQVKRQRHQQILQTEADEAAGKALQRYMYRAFNDLSGAPTTDSNPLVRQNKLSRTNPLL
ncbi:hypothetical protein ABBQ38_005789 [Trebouxia sp. C0009 RCD-2024]